MFAVCGLRHSMRSMRRLTSATKLVAGQYPVFDQSSTFECQPPRDKIGQGQREATKSIVVDSKLIESGGPVIVGIAGGSASGKTTLAKAIIEALGSEHVSFIGHDSYYKELSHMPIEQRAEVNFDHPSSLDTNLLVQHLLQLKKGENVRVPIYDFATHTRTAKTELITPRSIIIVDGILIFAEPQLMSLMDMKIFVDTDDDLRLIRRMKRDINERQRSVESVISQYTHTVRPMHLIYVEPSKRGADIIVPASQGIQPVALDMCVSRLREIINQHKLTKDV